MLEISDQNSTESFGMHWIKFNLVGALGMVVQIILLKVFYDFLKMHYLLASSCAVELTVIHNYVWHERWTWRNRPSESIQKLMQRFVHFNVTNGALSIFGSIFLQQVFHGWYNFPVSIVNLISIVVLSVLNFIISNSFVFRKQDIVKS